MSDIPNIPPWNGEQTNDGTKIPWYFPSQEYNKNYLNDIRYALDNNKSYSWVRIGDGEIAVLQQEYVHSLEYIKKNIGWGQSTYYCGVKLPNTEARDRLINAINNADLVGVFKGDPPTEEVFNAIQLQPKNICYAYDSVGLPMNKDFVQMLIDYPPLLIGGGTHTNEHGLKTNAEFYANKFKEILDIDVPGFINNVNNINDIDSVMEDIMKYDFKLCCVSAGVGAKIICSEMAKKKNAVFLDMGHAWDNAFHPKGRYDEYWLLNLLVQVFCLYNHYVYHVIAIDKLKPLSFPQK